MYLLSTYDVVHVTSRTRPSHFSAWNIEKLGMGLGTRLHRTICTCTLWCSGKDLAWSARVPRFKPWVGFLFFSVRSFIITLINFLCGWSLGVVVLGVNIVAYYINVCSYDACLHIVWPLYESSYTMCSFLDNFFYLVCRLLEKKKKTIIKKTSIRQGG